MLVIAQVSHHLYPSAISIALQSGFQSLFCDLYVVDLVVDVLTGGGLMPHKSDSDPLRVNDGAERALELVLVVGVCYLTLCG